MTIVSENDTLSYNIHRYRDNQSNIQRHMRDSRRYVLSRSARRLPSHSRDGESLDTTALRKLIQSTDTSFVDSLLGKPHHSLPTLTSTSHSDTLPSGKRLRRIPRPCLYIIIGMMLMYGILYFWEQRHTHQWWKWYRYQLNTFQMTPETIALRGGRPMGQQQQQQQQQDDYVEGGRETQGIAQPILNQNQGYTQGNHHNTNQIMLRNLNNNVDPPQNPTFNVDNYEVTSRRTTNNNGNTNTQGQRLDQGQGQSYAANTNNENGSGNNRFKSQPSNSARVNSKTVGGTTQTQIQMQTQTRSSNPRISGGVSSTSTNGGRMSVPVAPINNVFVGGDTGNNQGNRALVGGRTIANQMATETIQSQLDNVNSQLRTFQSQSAQQPGFFD